MFFIFSVTILSASSTSTSQPRPRTEKKNLQLAGHCLAVASWLTHLQSHFMKSYWIGFLVRSFLFIFFTISGEK